MYICVYVCVHVHRRICADNECDALLVSKFVSVPSMSLHCMGVSDMSLHCMGVSGMSLHGMGVSGMPVHFIGTLIPSSLMLPVFSHVYLYDMCMSICMHTCMLACSPPMDAHP